ncbi:ATP-binding protein [Pseudorhizobium halotolerans]|uniref:ATP-binding protein n=1 Tax=Pseudorhizobium halotolerans TaxID=1233081 RepID=A0ABN7JFS3_9HYPH|nr:ATP-binding protein [Pseudorhizobium halotolerans]CAD7026961.1 ATP-binding protein [Pseudorhizobium halotolerans]
MPNPAKPAVPPPALGDNALTHPELSGTSADRIANHLMRRIRHGQLWKRVEVARSLELLVPIRVSVNGYSLRRYVVARDHGLSGKPIADLAVLRRMFLSGRRALGQQLEISGEGLTSAGEAEALAAERCRNIEWPYLLALLDALSSVDDTANLAIVRLLSRALAECGLPRSSVLSRLNQPGSLILIRSEVEGFGEKLVELLKADVLFERRTRIERQGSPASTGRNLGIRPDRTMRLINDEDLGDTDHRELEQQAAEALSRGSQVLVLHGADIIVPPALLAAADLELTIRPIDWNLIQPLLAMLQGGEGGEVSLTTSGELVLRRFDHLILALRPSRSREDAVRLLGELTRLELASGAESDGGSSGQSGAGLGSRRGGRSTSRVKSTGSRLIQPETLVDACTTNSSSSVSPPAKPRHLPLTVETLSGYGEARSWALDLRSDLKLWRDGAIEWEEMSTRLLLSGPPGTGKTTFARALCNSLQLPMLATSVATWLQPSYLGDVLKRMSRAFEEAQRNAPSILFIDECDAIGSRQDNARDHADYWNTVIARLLELLDGAARTSGVIIVGATNRPEFIDRALTRSGRLEKHVVIPKPDVDALCGILAHHVGSDLASVLETAPQAWTSQGEAEVNR